MDLIKRDDAIKRLAFVLENMEVSLFGIKGERLAKLILDGVPAADKEK